VKIIDIARNSDKALLIGIGGGGDVISTYYIWKFLEKFEVECIFAGVIWERYRRDRKPGPRRIDEISGIERLSETLGFLKGGERIGDVTPIASQFAEFVGERVLALSITEGVERLKRDLSAFIEENGVDVVFAVDAGGDSLATGSEKNLISPLSDSLMISALKDFNSVLAVVGFGSDGELSREEIEMYLSELSSSVLGVSLVEFDERFMSFIRDVESEASRIPALTRTGYRGTYNFWGEIEIEVSFLNSLIFYLDLKSVYERSKMAKAVEKASKIEEASRILNSMGIKTEYDLEIGLAMRDGLL